MSLAPCELCGRSRDEHNRHVRFKLPDPLLKFSPEELQPRTWGNDVLLQVQGVGAFVRALLPVRLIGGDSVTFGLWVGVHPDELRRLYEIWNAPAYLDHEFEAWCANAVPPWNEELLAAPLVARPREQDALPYVTRSDDPVLATVIDREWQHDFVLSGLP